MLVSLHAAPSGCSRLSRSDPASCADLARRLDATHPTRRLASRLASSLFGSLSASLFASLAAALAGGLAGQGLLWPERAAWTPLGLAGWLWLVGRSGPWRAPLSGGLFGTAFAWGSAPWLPDALERLGGPSTPGLLIALLLAAGVGGAPYGLLALVVDRTRRASPALRLAILAGSVFLLETWVLRSRALPPWLLIGHAASGMQGLCQLAVAGGVPTLSAILAASAHALALLAENPRDSIRRRLVIGLLGGLLSLAVVGEPALRRLRGSDPGDGSESLSVLLVQPSLQPARRWDPGHQALHLERLLRLSKRALRDGAGDVDLVLWPETSITQPLAQRPWLDALRDGVAQLQVPLLAGTVRRAARTPDSLVYRNAALLFDEEGDLVAGVEKAIPVPILEAAPETRLERFLAGLADRPPGGRSVERVREGTSDLVPPKRIAVLLCYEALFADLSRSRRERDTLLLVQLADDGWIEDPAAVRQIIRLTAFRAIEQRLPLVRVSHGGLSVVIDEYGVLRHRLPEDRESTFAYTAHPTRPAGPTERLAILSLPLLALAGSLTLPMRRRGPPGLLDVSRPRAARRPRSHHPCP
ncbi:MAG TPA: apolipoprotein N-acyltransferase [Myxococcota bacterium]|nr:apolipoprotein N-acyltransferase [Myxococcota bacterium]